MEERILQIRTMAVAVIIGLFGVAGKMYAYDFSAVCSTGQTLYYNIINTTNHYVELTYPGSSMWDPWNGYTQPIGIIELPEHVNYEGIEYTITKIGSSAFSNCTGLSGDIVIPNSVKTIDYKSFYNCVGFTGNLVLGNSLRSIGQEAFSCCSNLTGNLTIPNSVTTIGWKSFKECNNFSGTLTIGNSVEYIVSEAFYNCTGITSFSIPSSVIVIGENAFYGTGWYNNHSNGVLYQSNWCIGYKGAASGSLTINTNTRGIASHAFYGKTFNKIYYKATNCMDVYEDNVPPFENCSGSLVIGNNVERIPPYMFQWANFSGSIIIPNSVTTIGDYAFNGCNSVYSISLSEFIVSIGQKAFYNTGWYNSQSGVLYLNDWCIGYKGMPTGSLSIQEGTKGIADYAFDNCSGYNEELTLPSSLVYIGNSAFYGCNFIGSLNIPNSVVSIGYSAFMFCSHFNGSLSIPQSIITIGRSAFYYCPGFTSMTIFADNPPILGEFAFEYVDKSIPVYVPYGTISAYQAAPGWNEFTNYQEMPSSSVTQTIDLSAGWNWCSFYVDITLDDLKSALVETLPGTSITISSQTQSTVYNGTEWRGQLSTLDVAMMYKIMVTQGCELTLEGMPVNAAEHPVTISNGYNWIAYPLSQSMSLSNAFAGFAVSGDVVSSQTQNATYNGTMWRGTLGSGILEPGKGYKYNSNATEPRTFTYPSAK